VDLRSSIQYCSDAEKRSGCVWSAGFSLPGEQVPVLSRTDLRPWQELLVQNLGGPPDDRTIEWYYDYIGGQGKTAVCKHILSNFSDVLFLSTSSAKDASHQIVKRTKPYKIILINFPRQAEGKISYASMEAIKDGLVYSGKYEGGFKLFPPPHLIVFANWQPDVNQLSQDRWKITELV